MLRICEKYAFNFEIIFNGTKVSCYYFYYISTIHNEISNLKMRDGNILPIINKCVHLGTTIHL